MADNVTILVVEDEDALRNLYETWLRDEGFLVRGAASGEEALEKWDDDVDIAIIDRRMPGMSGDEVLKASREQGYYIPVSMVTAVLPDVDVIGMEFDDYITKPVSHEKLIRVVDRLTTISTVRETVREFVRSGLIIHRLQNEHTMDELKTHAEYQELKQEFKQLQEELVGTADELTTYEKRLLIRARTRL